MSRKTRLLAGALLGLLLAMIVTDPIAQLEVCYVCLVAICFVVGTERK